MSPEVLLPELRQNSVNLNELKFADLWALGMVIFVMINPDITYPYKKELQEELEKNSLKSGHEILDDFFSKRNIQTSLANMRNTLRQTGGPLRNSTEV